MGWNIWRSMLLAHNNGAKYVYYAAPEGLGQKFEGYVHCESASTTQLFSTVELVGKVIFVSIATVE